ncbi:START-like domain-containing protein [Tanacetum coccineum]
MHPENQLREQQEQLKGIYEKFKEEVDQHLEKCRRTLEGLETHQVQVKGMVEKQKVSHKKFLMQTEEAIETQLNDAHKRIADVHRLAKEKMLTLKKGIAECLKEGLLGEGEVDGEVEGVEVEIEKVSRNRRRIRSKVAIDATLETVWGILTDYERLADYIPGLVVSQVLDKQTNFARLLQIGQQNLAFGLKFNAKGVVDFLEKDFEVLMYGQRRDIDFKMIEGDFDLFEGTWSILYRADSGKFKCRFRQIQIQTDISNRFRQQTAT